MDPSVLPIRTMVVDDDRLMRCLLTGMLCEAGFETQTASTCKQALVLYDEFQPDLVLCDWELPDAAGIDLVRHIRYVQKDRPPCVMMVSAHCNHDARANALHAGANDYLTKPIKRSVLLARLNEVMQVRDLHLQRQFTRAE